MPDILTIQDLVAASRRLRVDPTRTDDAALIMRYWRQQKAVPLTQEQEDYGRQLARTISAQTPPE